jgi:xanthine/CO dehydrogenase XdhC/CoxF family maturation factor
MLIVCEVLSDRLLRGVIVWLYNHCSCPQAKSQRVSPVLHQCVPCAACLQPACTAALDHLATAALHLAIMPNASFCAAGAVCSQPPVCAGRHRARGQQAAVLCTHTPKLDRGAAEAAV